MYNIKNRLKYQKHIILIFIAIIQIFPLIIVFLNSFRSDGDIKTFPFGLPTFYNFDNYIKAWITGGYGIAFLNSIKISSITTLLVIVVSICGGYIMAKSTIKLKNFFLVYFGFALSIPLFLYFIPLYYYYAKLGLVNTHIGIIIIYCASNIPFNILFARTFILGIPNELIEAAVLDGCNHYNILRYIIFPLSKPIVTTIGLIVFIATWNEFILANTFLQRVEMKTISTRYVVFTSEHGADYAMIFTAAAIMLIPIIFVFIKLQNHFIEGMASGSIK